MVMQVVLFLLTYPKVPKPSEKGENTETNDGAAKVNTRHTRRVQANPWDPRSLPYTRAKLKGFMDSGDQRLLRMATS